jgi:hypothetical protein
MEKPWKLNEAQVPDGAQKTPSAEVFDQAGSGFRLEADIR